MGLTGAQIIVRKLIENKVDIVFEFPGGAICPILDELYRLKRIKTICFRHEQAAMHAADSYARITKRPSVCMATSGPGASNLVTGIANAFMDSVPVVVITGQVAVWDLKKDRPVRQRGFQELDIVSIVKTITKASFLVHNVSDLSLILDKAFSIAQEGRPGPVLVDVPINLQYTPSSIGYSKAHSRKIKPIVCKHSVIKYIAKKMLFARKPLVLAGGGIIISDSRTDLGDLVYRHRLPVAETLMGLTGVSTDYALNLGLVGYAGSRAAAQALKEADFVLGLGLRFDNRAFPCGSKDFSRFAFIAQVDCDKNEFNHRVIVGKIVFSDLKYFLKELALELKRMKYISSQDWMNKIANLKKENVRLNEKTLTPRLIMEKLSAALKNKNTVVTTDVGQHQLWMAQYFKFNQRHRLVTSGGLGTMGFGLPAAIGAQFADKESIVLNITSDGSFQMNIQELATIRDYNLPVKIILLNNKCLGLVRQIQEFAFSQRYASTRLNSNVDFCKIVESYGIDAFCLKKVSEIDSALSMFISARKSIFLEVQINEFENVYPMHVKGEVIYGDANA